MLYTNNNNLNLWHTVFSYNEEIWGPNNRKVPIPTEDSFILEAGLTLGGVAGSLLLTSIPGLAAGGLAMLVAQTLLGSAGGVLGSEVAKELLKLGGAKVSTIYDSLLKNNKNIPLSDVALNYGYAIATGGLQSFVIGRASRLFTLATTAALKSGWGIGSVMKTLSGKPDLFLDHILGQPSVERSFLTNGAVRLIKEFSQEEIENTGHRLGTFVGGETIGSWVETVISILNGSGTPGGFNPLFTANHSSNYQTDYLNPHKNILPNFQKTTLEVFQANANQEISLILKDIYPVEKTLRHPQSTPSWDSTIIPTINIFDRLGRIKSLIDVAKATRCFSHNGDSNSYSALLTQVENGMQDCHTRLLQNPKYYQSLVAVQKNGESLLTPEQKILIEYRIKNAKAKGAHLTPEKQKRLGEIEKGLAVLCTRYQSNIAQSPALNVVEITDASQLKGVPEAVSDTWKIEGQSIWRIPSTPANYGVIGSVCDVQETRRKMWTAFFQHASEFSATNEKGESINNVPLLAQMRDLRNEFAGLMGYENYAEYTVQNASRFENVAAMKQFLNARLESLKEVVATNLEALKAKAREEGVDDIGQWDLHYYIRKLGQTPTGFNTSQYHFPFSAVKNHAFGEVAGEFGLTITEIPKIDGSDPRFSLYTVKDSSGTDVGTIYLDAFNRVPDGKTTQNQAIEMIVGRRANGSQPAVLPIAIMSVNYPPPKEGESDVNLDFQQVKTFFHEFGHILHMIAAGSKANYQEIGSIYPLFKHTDLGEVPSFDMEARFTKDASTIAKLAKHKQTNAAPTTEEVEEYLKKPLDISPSTLSIISIATALTDLEMYLSNQDPNLIQNDILEKYLNFGLSGKARRAFCRQQHPSYGEYAAKFWTYITADALAEKEPMSPESLLRFMEQGSSARL